MLAISDKVEQLSEVTNSDLVDRRIIGVCHSSNQKIEKRGAMCKVKTNLG